MNKNAVSVFYLLSCNILEWNLPLFSRETLCTKNLDKGAGAKNRNNLWRESNDNPGMLKIIKMKKAFEKDKKPTVSLKFNSIQFA